MRTLLLFALFALLGGCAGKPAATTRPDAPAGPRPDPVIGESACSAVATCEDGRALRCSGTSECSAVDGVGCRALQSDDQPPKLSCCDGSQTCSPTFTAE